MKDLPSAAELHEKLGAPSSEAVDGLQLLKAFLKLSSQQQFEIIELVERLAAERAAEDGGRLLS